jgi:hypothetical protein
LSCCRYVRVIRYVQGNEWHACAQECFNSPYGVNHFPQYAEKIGYTPGQPFEPESSESESVRMLSAAAKELKTWLIGGICFVASELVVQSNTRQARSLRGTPRTILNCTTLALSIIHKVSHATLWDMANL